MRRLKIKKHNNRRQERRRYFNNGARFLKIEAKRQLIRDAIFSELFFQLCGENEVGKVGEEIQINSHE